ncbi:Glycosyl transferases group 1 [anaerobic digester metagenome]
MTSIVDLRKSQHNRPHQFVKHLSKNHEVTVLSINDWWKGSQTDMNSYSSDLNDFLQNVDIRYLTDTKVSPVLQELFFTREIKKLSKEDFDVHFNYNSLITGSRFSKDFKTVFDLADDLPEMIAHSPQIPGFLKGIGKWMGERYLKRDIEQAELVTLTTETLKETYNVPDEKSVIIPNGVNTENFKNVVNAKEELGIEGFIVGYVGVLREWVDLEPVLRALKELPEDIKLLVVGSEGEFQENRELAARSGLGDRVIFTGMVPYSRVPLYISAMDVGLIPFKTNGIANNALPIKLFEYMACEKPVISTELTPVTSKFNNNVLYASNSEEYLQCIELLHNDEELRRRMGKKGRKIVLSGYDWEFISKKLEDVLKEVC